MRLHLALGTSPKWQSVINDIQVPNILVSFAYKGVIGMVPYKPQSYIVDSGAFSAWASGKSVDLKAYGDWALTQTEKAERFVAVNLDVIPGEKGRTSTKAERLVGMRKSLENADYLRSLGLNIMEVYHQDEPLSFLGELCDRLPIDGVIGISPRNDVSVNKKIEWQNVVLRYLYQRYGKSAFPRCHGLAVTSKQMIESFPYYSVDSSTWVGAAMFGKFVNEDGKSGDTRTLFKVSPRAGQTGAMQTAIRHTIENLFLMEQAITKVWTSRGIQWKD